MAHSRTIWTLWLLLVLEKERCVGDLAMQMGTLMRMVTPVMKAVQDQNQTVTENLQMIGTLSTMVDAQRSRFDQFWGRVETARAALRVGQAALEVNGAAAPGQWQCVVPAGDTVRCVPKVFFFKAIDTLSQQLRGRGGGDDHVLASAEVALTTGDESAVGMCAELCGLEKDAYSFISACWLTWLGPMRQALRPPVTT